MASIITKILGDSEWNIDLGVHQGSVRNPSEYWVPSFFHCLKAGLTDQILCFDFTSFHSDPLIQNQNIFGLHIRQKQNQKQSLIDPKRGHTWPIDKYSFLGKLVILNRRLKIEKTTNNKSYTYASPSTIWISTGGYKGGAPGKGVLSIRE